MKIVSKNVNNKRLCEEIKDAITNVITTLAVNWSNEAQRCSFVEMIEEFMVGEFIESGTITQFKIVCDSRNNPKGFISPNKIFLELYYKQPHCLNTTSLQFHIPNNYGNKRRR